MPFSGAVLTGGSSVRMGTDKAFVEIDGEPLVRIAQRALEAAGAADIHSIGGDVERLGRLGLIAHPDRYPNEGPLGGLIEALAVARCRVVVVLACDQPNVDAVLVGRLAASVGADDEAIVPVVDDVPQPLAAAYAADAGASLAEAFADGERSPRRALAQLRWRELRDVDPSVVLDLDDPTDLARYASSHRATPRGER